MSVDNKSVRYSADISGETLEEIREEAEKVLRAFFGDVPLYDLVITGETMTFRSRRGDIVSDSISHYNATIEVRT